MSRFADLDAFLAPGFSLPIRGKTYEIPAPTAKEGLWLQTLMDASESMLLAGNITKSQRQVLGDEDERGMYQIALGPAYDQMVEDAVQWPILKHAGITAFLYWTRGPEQAERFWAGYGQGKAPTAEEEDSPPGGSPEDPSTPPPA